MMFTEGGGNPNTNAVRQLSKGSHVADRGKGVKKSENFADVI